MAQFWRETCARKWRLTAQRSWPNRQHRQCFAEGSIDGFNTFQYQEMVGLPFAITNSIPKRVVLIVCEGQWYRSLQTLCKTGWRVVHGHGFLPQVQRVEDRYLREQQDRDLPQLESPSMRLCLWSLYIADDDLHLVALYFPNHSQNFLGLCARLPWKKCGKLVPVPWSWNRIWCTCGCCSDQ